MIEFRLDDDRIVLDADGIEASVLTGLTRQLSGMLGARAEHPVGDRPPSVPDDPALARLLPDLLADDPDGARELRSLTEPSLVAIKREQLRLVDESLASPGPLDEAAETAWLRAMTDLRLTIATRLGIEVDGDLGKDADESDRALQSVFAWLGGLQEHLIELLDARDEARAVGEPVG